MRNEGFNCNSWIGRSLLVATCLILVVGIVIISRGAKSSDGGRGVSDKLSPTEPSGIALNKTNPRATGVSGSESKSARTDFQNLLDPDDPRLKFLKEFEKRAELTDIADDLAVRSAVEGYLSDIKAFELREASLEFVGDRQVVIRIPGVREPNFSELCAVADETLQKRFPEEDMNTIQMLRNGTLDLLMLSDRDQLIDLATNKGILNLDSFSVWRTAEGVPGTVTEQGSVKGSGFGSVVPANPLLRGRFDYIDSFLADMANAGKGSQ